MLDCTDRAKIRRYTEDLLKSIAGLGFPLEKLPTFEIQTAAETKNQKTFIPVSTIEKLSHAKIEIIEQQELLNICKNL